MLMYGKNPFHFHALEKEMATHSSVPAWRIPETVEPGGLGCRLWGRTELATTGATWQQAAAWQETTQYCKAIIL